MKTLNGGGIYFSVATLATTAVVAGLFDSKVFSVVGPQLFSEPFEATAVFLCLLLACSGFVWGAGLAALFRRLAAGQAYWQLFAWAILLPILILSTFSLAGVVGSYAWQEAHGQALPGDVFYSPLFRAISAMGWPMFWLFFTKGGWFTLAASQLVVYAWSFLKVTAVRPRSRIAIAIA